MCLHTDTHTHTHTTVAPSTYETHMKHMCTRTSTPTMHMYHAYVYLNAYMHTYMHNHIPTVFEHKRTHTYTNAHPRSNNHTPTRSTHAKYYPRTPYTHKKCTAQNKKCTAASNNKQHTNKGKTCLQLHMMLLLGRRT